MEVIAWGTPDGQALVRFDDREFVIARRDATGRMEMPGLCPLEMLPVALAA